MKTTKAKQEYPESLKATVTFLNKRKWLPSKLIFLILGILSTCWCLIRIIPKPSRASYPCMRAAAPFATSFVTYILGLTGIIASIKFIKKYIQKARYFLVGLSVSLGVIALIALAMLKPDFAFAQAQEKPVYETQYHVPNQPIGEPTGINPGRVTWIHNPDATNENCTNFFGDGYWELHNNNPELIKEMIDKGLLLLTNKPTIKKAWDAVFKYYNKKQYKKEQHNKKSSQSTCQLSKNQAIKGYVHGEKIFIKINMVSAWTGNIMEDLSRNPFSFGITETSPYVALAVLEQLIDDYGVAQEDITLGDPMRDIYQNFYELWSGIYPDVKYLGLSDQLGRTLRVVEEEPAVYYSDRGTVLHETGNNGEIEDPVYSDQLSRNMLEAKYIINIPALKAHARAGISVTGKNHFGSHSRPDAKHLHPGLVNPFQDLDPSATRGSYGMYRVQVDLLGHEHLGGKTVLSIVDALWTGSEATDPPRKFQMAPFNNDYTSSILMSQDAVALESVCFDILRTEFRDDNPYCTYPNMPAVDDYLHQAASRKNWPEDIIYDPENDGTPITSLGVHEHWENEISMNYSQNLQASKYPFRNHGYKKRGIELIKNFSCE